MTYLAAALFLWAATATAIVAALAVANLNSNDTIKRLRDDLADERAMRKAASLSEYEHWRGKTAMPAVQYEDDTRYGYDATGLVRVVIPPTE